MDHEYNISGYIRGTDASTVLEGALQRRYRFKDFCFVIALEKAKEADSALTVVPEDRCAAECISESDVSALCRDLSVEFHAKVRLCRVHEEYGLLNVFNGGSDYEVVCSDRFICEYDDGNLVTQEKVTC